MMWGILTLRIGSSIESDRRVICDAVRELWKEIEAQCIGLMLPSQQGKVDSWIGEAIQLLGPNVAAKGLEKEVMAEEPALEVEFHQLSDEQFAEARGQLEEALRHPVQYDGTKQGH
jgi:hypothetical protein